MKTKFKSKIIKRVAKPFPDTNPYKSYCNDVGVVLNVAPNLSISSLI